MAQPWYFNNPMDVAVDGDGFLYIADTGNFRIVKYTKSGDFVSSWGGGGSGREEFVNPAAAAFHPDGYIYVSDRGYYAATGEQVSRVQKFTLSGQWVSEFGEWGEGNGQFKDPRGIAVDKEGGVYVADSGNNRIQKFTSNDVYINSWPIFFIDAWEYAQVVDVAVEPDGNILVLVDRNSSAPDGETFYPVQRFPPDGVLLDKWPMDPEDYNGLYGICVDEDHNIYVSEIWNHQIKVYSKEGGEIGNIREVGVR